MVTYPICAHCDQSMRRPDQPASEHPGTVRIASQTCCGACRRRINRHEINARVYVPDAAQVVITPPVVADTQWRARARCRDVDIEVFFPDGRTDAHTSQYAAAKAICQACPVLLECREAILRLEHGLRFQDRYGMVAALRPAQRTRLDLDGSLTLRERDVQGRYLA